MKFQTLREGLFNLEEEDAPPLEKVFFFRKQIVFVGKNKFFFWKAVFVALWTATFAASYQWRSIT